MTHGFRAVLLYCSLHLIKLYLTLLQLSLRNLNSILATFSCSNIMLLDKKDKIRKVGSLDTARGQCGPAPLWAGRRGRLH